MLITTFENTHHMSLSKARPIQSTLSHLIYLGTMSILSSHLHLSSQNGFLPLGLQTNTVYDLSCLSCPACLILLTSHLIK
jgi:hypothetical protein